MSWSAVVRPRKMTNKPLENQKNQVDFFKRGLATTHQRKKEATTCAVTSVGKRIVVVLQGQIAFRKQSLAMIFGRGKGVTVDLNGGGFRL